MLRSTQRILTTHTGSLPRPEDLTQLYIDRGQGKHVDTEELASAGRQATRASIRSQADAGIAIGNNGEQPRDSFFLYLRDRLTGLGGSWERPTRADVERYPAFKKRWAQQASGEDKVSNVSGVPMAIGEVSYADSKAIEEECFDLEAALTENPGVFQETFMSSPSPGIVASALKNEYYDTIEDYLEALGKALQVEYETIVDHGFILQIDAPDLAMERHVTYKDQPLPVFLEFVETVVEVINRSLVNVPRERVRLHVCWGNSESPHDSDVPLADILPFILKADVGGFVLPFANPRHAHEYKSFCRPSTRRRPDPGGRSHRHSDQLRRAPRSRRRQTRARRSRRRRSDPCPCRHRLWIRHLGGVGTGSRGRGLGKVEVDECRCRARYQAALLSQSLDVFGLRRPSDTHFIHHVYCRMAGTNPPVTHSGTTEEEQG